MPLAVTVLMKVTADDQTHVGPIELVEEAHPSRRQRARGTHEIIGWTFEQERFVQEERGGPPGGTQLLVEQLILCAFPFQARAEKLRVDTNQAPTSGIQGEAIGGKRAVPSREPICIDNLPSEAASMREDGKK